MIGPLEMSYAGSCVSCRWRWRRCMGVEDDLAEVERSDSAVARMLGRPTPPGDPPAPLVALAPAEPHGVDRLANVLLGERRPACTPEDEQLCERRERERLLDDEPSFGSRSEESDRCPVAAFRIARKATVDRRLELGRPLAGSVGPRKVNRAGLALAQEAKAREQPGLALGGRLKEPRTEVRDGDLVT